MNQTVLYEYTRTHSLLLLNRDMKLRKRGEGCFAALQSGDYLVVVVVLLVLWVEPAVGVGVGAVVVDEVGVVVDLDDRWGGSPRMGKAGRAQGQ